MKRITKTLISFVIIFAMLAGFLPKAAAADELSYRYGTADLYSTFTSGETLTDSFYYTDAWFFEDPGVRNDSLALLSMQLTASAVEGVGGAGTAFLENLGFEEIGGYGFDSEDPDGFNYIWGKKEISSGGETAELIAVTIQSYSLDGPTKAAGWTQNFHVNEGEAAGEHYAFAKAVSKVIDSVAGLAGSGDTKYWIMGQSRGGALANLLAAKLPGKIGSGDIYAYTFEAPAVTDGDTADGNFAYIHNYICSDDIVTRIPPWGMARYGEDFILNTEEVDAKLAEELGRLGSDAAELAGDYPDFDGDGTAFGLMNAIIAAIPTRAEYSALHTDTFTADDGSEISLSYSYQDLLMNLMGLIFGGGLGGISIDSVADHVADLLPAIRTLVKAVSEDSDSAYYSAAGELVGFLKLVGISLPLSQEQLYALLKLAGPWMVDLTFVSSEEPAPDNELLGYVMPVVGLLTTAKIVMFSHHFDTLTARLKALAPAPEIDGLDIAIPAPAAGDAASAAPSAVQDYVDSLGNDWMSAEAGWEGGYDPLPDDKVCYFTVTLTVTGPVIPEDFALTLNGEDPVEPASVTYENGTYTISGTWTFTFGNPESCKVTFDTSGRIEAPAPAAVKAGEMLKNVITPAAWDIITHEGSKWQFGGWFDENGRAWDELTAESDITLYVKWIRLIDAVSLTMPIPHVGEEFTEPTVPEGCGYHAEDISFFDEHWDEAYKASEEGIYNVSFNLVCDSGDILFLQETDEYDFSTYCGRIFINDKEEKFNTYEDYGTSVSSEEGGRYLNVTYYFEVTSAGETPAPAPSIKYNIVSGEDTVWTKGSSAPAVLTVKRSEDDADCFGHFADVRIDGAVVDPANYEAHAGSTVISLGSPYLETLSVGTHSVLVKFDDGEALTTLTVKAAPAPSNAPTPSIAPKPTVKPAASIAPKPTARPAASTAPASGSAAASGASKSTSAKGSPTTGDSSNPLLWVAVIVVAAGVIFMLLRSKKK